MVGDGGFEPPKSLTTDLQSAPFGHLGNPPHFGVGFGACSPTRTGDLLITNQLLYQLSYTSITNRTHVSNANEIITNTSAFVNEK